MIVFLSFPSHDPVYRGIESVLRSRGLTVHTNFDRTDVSGVSKRTDLRLARIYASDAYVYFEDPDKRSRSRDIEFGYALGSEVPVAFVGRPTNSLHRYGDVFADVDEFLAGYYSAEYFGCLAEWYPQSQRRAKAVA